MGRRTRCAEFRVESLEFRFGVSAQADTFFICCPVGRGDPTPPGNRVVGAIFHDDVVFPAGL